MQIENKIREYILTNLYYSEDSFISDEDSFLATGVIDSMGVMELETFIQAEFGIEVVPSEIVVENFDSIHKLADFVRRKLLAKEPAPPMRTTENMTGTAPLISR